MSLVSLLEWNGILQHCRSDTVSKPLVVFFTLNSIKQYWLIHAVSCRNGITGFGPVPRDTITVERKGQIRDWPK